MKIVYYYYYVIIIIIAWRVTLFSCHASVLGDVYYNSIQREEHYSQLLHSTETGFSPAVWASLNLLLVLFFDRRLRIVIIIIIGPFCYLCCECAMKYMKIARVMTKTLATWYIKNRAN